jgi:hypothetical protein
MGHGFHSHGTVNYCTAGYQLAMFHDFPIENTWIFLKQHHVGIFCDDWHAIF